MIDCGVAAPEFALPSSQGVTIGRDDLVGWPVLVIFVPAAFTPICSNELGDIVSMVPRVEQRGGRVVVIACDSMFVLRAWAEHAGVDNGALVLLSDFWPHGQVCRRYDAFDAERGTATRTSYLLDHEGVVRWSTSAPAGVARDMAEHEQALAAVVEAV